LSLLRQGGHYVAFGLLQLLLDWLIFVGGTALGLPVGPANFIGRLAGMLLGFWLNGRFTFADSRGQRLGWARFARFLLLWLLLTAASTVLLAAASDGLGLRWAWLAKPLVEAGLAAVSFFAMRRFVYNA